MSEMYLTFNVTFPSPPGEELLDKLIAICDEFGTYCMAPLKGVKLSGGVCLDEVGSERALTAKVQKLIRSYEPTNVLFEIEDWGVDDGS